MATAESIDSLEQMKARIHADSVKGKHCKMCGGTRGYHSVTKRVAPDGTVTEDINICCGEFGKSNYALMEKMLKDFAAEEMKIFKLNTDAFNGLMKAVETEVQRMVNASKESTAKIIEAATTPNFIHTWRWFRKKTKRTIPDQRPQESM